MKTYFAHNSNQNFLNKNISVFKVSGISQKRKLFNSCAVCQILYKPTRGIQFLSNSFRVRTKFHRIKEALISLVTCIINDLLMFMISKNLNKGNIRFILMTMDEVHTIIKSFHFPSHFLIKLYARILNV